MNDKDKFDDSRPKPKFKAGDRVRWVHTNNRTGTVVDCHLSVQSRRLGQSRSGVLAAFNYEVLWDGSSAAAQDVREDWLKLAPADAPGRGKLT